MLTCKNSGASITNWDYIIVGAGIVGLSVARELRLREKHSSILILEKEKSIGLHASGRNSGVLHSGIYYPKGSLKANICSTGSTLMSNYCQEKNLPINKIGKIILPIHKGDDVQLEVLYNRAISNNALVEIVDNRRLKELEPEVKSITNSAIFSPNTSVVDPKSIMVQLQEDLKKESVCFMFQSTLKKVDMENTTISMGDKKYKFKVLINTAGQYSDQIAHMCGVGERYKLIPFRGSYYKLKKNSKIHLNHLIYPVPKLNMPFLGVHSVTTINGETYFGPSAVPALGREHYSGIDGIDFNDAVSTLTHLTSMYFSNNQNFRHYAHDEVGRFLKFNFIKAAKEIVPGLTGKSLQSCDKVGIRAQLYDTKEKKLVMDFLIEKRYNTIHVLNAVSPAFTSAFSMAKEVVDRAETL